MVSVGLPEPSDSGGACSVTGPASPVTGDGEPVDLLAHAESSVRAAAAMSRHSQTGRILFLLVLCSVVRC